MKHAVHQQDQDYPVLFVVPEQGAGPAARTVADRLRDRGLHVIVTQTRDDLRNAIAAHSRAGAARIGAAVVSWDLPGAEGELETRLEEIHRLTGQPPVVLLSEGPDERVVPPAIAGRTAGTFWLHADSPHFVADQVEWLVRRFALRSQVVGVLGGDIRQYGEIGWPAGSGQPDLGDAGRAGQETGGGPACWAQDPAGLCARPGYACS
jgi:Orn/Lys/Arg decarboxylase-like protein